MKRVTGLNKLKWLATLRILCFVQVTFHILHTGWHRKYSVSPVTDPFPCMTGNVAIHPQTPSQTSSIFRSPMRRRRQLSSAVSKLTSSLLRISASRPSQRCFSSAIRLSSLRFEYSSSAVAYTSPEDPQVKAQADPMARVRVQDKRKTHGCRMRHNDGTSPHACQINSTYPYAIAAR